MNKKLIIENTLVFLFVLLLLPFPKLMEEILIGSIFAVCFIFCFLNLRKCVKHVCEIFSYNIPYLTIVIFCSFLIVSKQYSGTAFLCSTLQMAYRQIA